MYPQQPFAERPEPRGPAETTRAGRLGLWLPAKDGAGADTRKARTRKGEADAAQGGATGLPAMQAPDS